MLPWIQAAVPYLKNTDDDSFFVFEFALVTKADDFDSATMPWSGLFIGYLMAQNGVEPPPGYLEPKAWANFGIALDEPAYGCIVVFERGASPDHVALYLGEDDKYYFCLGGNQLDKVCVTTVSKTRAAAYRWPATKDDLLVKGRKNTTIDEARKSSIPS